MIYGYARVNTKIKAKDGNSLENQEKELREAGATVVYKDKYTGTVASRPEFDKLIKRISKGDTLVVTKLDRIARSATEGLVLVREMIDRGVSVYILNIGKMDNTPTGKFIIQLIVAFAEFERDMLVERTQEGRAIARQHDGYHEGRPKKYSQEQIEHALKLLENHSYTQVTQMTGISKATLARAKRKDIKEKK